MGYQKPSKPQDQCAFGQKMIEATADVDVRSDIKTKFTMNSPFQHFEAITLELTHTGSLRPFSFATTAGIGYAPSKKIAISTKGQSTDSSIEGHLTFNTPITKARDGSINMVLSNRGNLLNFNADLDASINSEKMVVIHADLQTIGQIAGNFRLSTPVSGLESTTLTFTHKGELDDFECTAILSYAHGEIRSDVAFQRSPLSASLTVRTPYREAREATLKLSHSGNAYRFNTKASFEHNTLGTFSYTGQYKARRNINGEFNIQTPFANYENMYARFSHQNQLPSFNTEGEIGVGSKIMKGSAELSMDSNVQARLNLQTPFSAVEDFMFTLTKEGSVTDFQADVKVDLNRKNHLEAHANLKTDGNIQGNLNVITKLGTHSVTFSQSGDITTKIITTGMVQYPGGRISSAVNLRLVPTIDGTFQFQSPCPYLRDLTLAAKYQNNRNGYSSEVTFEHNLVGKITGSTAIGLYPTISGSASLETPFEAVRNVNMKFSHVDEGARYESKAEASYNGQTYSASGDMSLNSVDGSLQIRTPHAELRDLSVVVSQTGSRANAGLTYNRQQIAQAEGSFTQNPIQASLTIRTQSDYLRILEIEASHQGDMHNCQSSGSLKYNSKKMVSGQMNMRLTPDIEASLQLNTASPYLDNLFTKVSHRGDLSAFNCEGSVSYNNAHNFEGSLDFSERPLQAKVTLKTPYDGAHDVRAAFNHNGKWKKFQSHAEVSYDQGKFEADGMFQALPLKVIGSIKTPFEGARNLNAMLKHKGDAESFTTHAEASADRAQWESDLAFQREPLEASVELRTPFRGYRKLTAAVSQKGNTGHVEASIQQNKIEADGFLQIQPLNANIAVKTPFDGVRTLNAAIQHDGDLSSFSSRAEAGYENGRFLVGCAYSRSPLQGSFNLQTPFNGANNINLAFNQEGNNGHVEGSCDYGKVEADGSLQLEPFNANIHIQTPIEGARNVKAAVNHRGSAGHAEASYDFGRFEADGSFNRQPLRANLQIKTPYNGARNLNAALNYMGSSAHAEASYDFGKYEADGSFTAQPLQGKLHIQTPHRYAHNLKAAFNQQHDSAHVEASYDEGEYVVDGSFTRQPLQANLTHTNSPQWCT